MWNLVLVLLGAAFMGTLASNVGDSMYNLAMGVENAVTKAHNPLIPIEHVPFWQPATAVVVGLGLCMFTTYEYTKYRETRPGRPKRPRKRG